MKDLRSILIFLVVLVVVGLSLLVLVAKKPANAPTQTTGTVQQTTLSSDLDSLDATDIDTGVDSQLDQVTSESSTF